MAEDIVSQVLSLHDRWNGMKGRARQTGRTVSSEWSGVSGRERFVRWSLANGYSKELVLDRQDNTLGYSEENCKWVTNQENVAKELRKYKVGDTYYTMSEIHRAGFCHPDLELTAFRARLGVGWKLEEAMSRAPNHGNKRRT